MSGYLNCGASHTVSRKRIRTKKEMRELLAVDPSSVTFDVTSMYDPLDDFTGDRIPDKTALTVVGPDPYMTRRWYASVTRKTDGTLKVS